MNPELCACKTTITQQTKSYISAPSELIVLAGGHAANMVRVPRWSWIFWQLLQSVLVHVVTCCGEDHGLVALGGGNDVGHLGGVQTQLLEFVELVVLHDVLNSWWKLGSKLLNVIVLCNLLSFDDNLDSFFLVFYIYCMFI